MKAISLAASCLAALAIIASGEELFPAKDWVEKPSPWANPDAPKGGRLILNGHSQPGSVNYYLENSVFTATVFSLLYDSLLSSDPETGDHAPSLASEWTVSDDGLSFTFTIDPSAKWSDGKPVCAEDVRWTFEAIMAPDSMTGPEKVALSVFSSPQILSERKIRFTATESHWRNLGAIGSLMILPSHIFAGKDFNSLKFDFPVVSGPYRLSSVEPNVSMRLARRPDWWAAKRPANAGLYNFDEIVFRYFGTQENAFDAFRQGLLDIYPVYTAAIWARETRGERFDKNWIVKRAIRNRKPVGFQGFAMNMRREPFGDLRVRRALAMLLDRDGFNRTLMYGQYFLHRSYWEDLYGEDHPCPNELIRFDPEKAKELLSEAGFKIDPKSGKLCRDGKPFVVRFLSNSPTSDKFLARYKQALASCGIGLETVRKDWAAWARDMDSFDFDMTWCAWGSGLHKDPEGMWSSAHVDTPGGINLTGFKDARVDELIEAQKTEFSLEARNEIDRQIDAILCEQVPYILLWNVDCTRLLWWNKFGVPKSVLSRFGSEDDAIALWWADSDAEDALRDAMSIGAPLPPPPMNPEISAQ